MLKVAFHNLGCKVNAYENERMIQMFIKKGHEIVPFDQKADVYIINTCTVTNIADRKSRQMLHRSKQLNPESIVVACGCYVDTGYENARSDRAIDILVKNKEKDDIVAIVEGYLKTREKDPGALDREEEPYIKEKEKEGLENRGCDQEGSHLRTGLYKHTRAYLKIQDGCDQFCSYCVIPFARGRISSRSDEDIGKDLNELSKRGIKELVLTGIHLSSFGLDREEVKCSYNMLAKEGGFTNRALIRVIEMAQETEGIERIRLGSLEPRIITEEFLRSVSSYDKLCPHFHLSLQSGSDSVLKRMNRQYSTEEFFEKLLMIRETFEHPAITTDVIVGFPGESEEEFLRTRDFLNKADLYESHIFKYSRRAGTLADKMEGQLTDKVKSQRSRILIEDGKKRAKSFREYYISREKEVLFEEKQNIFGEDYYVGYTGEYVKCACKSDLSLENIIKKGKISGMLSEEILVFL
ncbi:MAG: tRNA (N(6)-L-threonylcarbamoyladenosine(37)-C(2))-methylthiotransferase MtaB [Lachnospiraceae bacterium]|nr:tRNA (N(6)-L-threonylcarbamoyladenosine(37)-C(2))-methylthiotransferase MtaB [Lachnospiraceae bacterium]